MLNAENITFRCKLPPHVDYVPEYMHDVVEMRKHPEYDELDANGQIVVQPSDGIERPTLKVTPPAAPKAGKGRKAK